MITPRAIGLYVYAVENLMREAAALAEAAENDATDGAMDAAIAAVRYRLTILESLR